ncbi:MAG TPA: rhodanese-like domain-containing protein [Lacunisphaera sp.]
MNLFWLLLAAAGGFFVLRMFFLGRPGLDLASAKAALQSGTAVLVDVREPGEWRGGVARQAVLLPLSDLRGSRAQWRSFLEKNPGKKLLLYCQSGTRSGLAAAQLRGEGVDAVNVGSLRDWDRAGWPVCTPRSLR